MNQFDSFFVPWPKMETILRSFITLLAFLIFGGTLLAQAPIGYDLESPDQVFVLPEYLEEVSGLSLFAPNQLAMLNDEHGRMYVYDLLEKKIVHRVRFEGNGDFEGIERVGDYVYAIKSNGKLYRFNVNMEGVVQEIKTPFSSENNVEGLGYNPISNQLLIALKDKGDLKDVEVKGKAIYGYDISTEQFLKLPLFVLRDKEVERVIGSKFKFKPSGVAVNPVTNETYVIAATQRALLVFDSVGKPKHLVKLRGGLFPQPEGITFSENGDLFISNEVEGEGGTILKFSSLNN